MKLIYQDGYAKNSDFKNNLRINKVLEILNTKYSKSATSFLDVGCGSGELTIEAANILGASIIYGVDISNHACNEAKNRSVNAIEMDIDNNNFPFQSNFFDFIYCGSLVELVLDPDHMMEEIHRILKDDGVLIITLPNMSAWLSRIACLFGRFPFYYRVSTKYDFGKLFMPIKHGKSSGFIRLFTTHAFKKFASLHKFELVELIGVGENNIPKVLRIFDIIFSLLPTLAFQNIFILKKSSFSN